MNSYGDQKETINKFFVDDWKRKEFAYDTCFEGEQYHLVRHKDNPRLEVVPNDINIK